MERGLIQLFAQLRILIHSVFSGPAVVSAGFLRVLAGAYTMFIHGTDQNEEFRVFLEEQRASDFLDQVITVLVVQIGLCQSQFCVVGINYSAVMGYRLDYFCLVFVGCIASLASEGTRVEPQLLALDRLMGISQRQQETG